MPGLSRFGARLGFVSVTDGEASHPGSARWTSHALRSARREEFGQALDVLGVEGTVVRLRFRTARSRPLIRACWTACATGWKPRT